MRRWFSFKSKSYEDDNKKSSLPASKSISHKLEGDVAFSGSATSDESVSKFRKRHADQQDCSSSHLMRSLSFSSPAPFHYADEFDCNFSQDFSRGGPRIYQNPKQHLSDCPIHQHLVHPDRYLISRNRHFSLSDSDSPFIFTAPVNCQNSHNTNLQNKISVLDVYIEGEQWQGKISHPSEEDQSTFPDTKRQADLLSRKTSALNLGKPPCCHSGESNCFKEVRDLQSETITSIEDIYEDTSDGKVFLSSILANVCGADKALLMKAQEADEILAHLSEENFESDRLKLDGVNAKALLTIIREINEDRKFLARELSTQIKSRLAERFDLKDKYRKSRLELDVEKEPDRHSHYWLVKLGKYELEEKRLRDRVRELAEENVALQREVSSLKSRGEIEAKSGGSETLLNQLIRENMELKQSLMEVTETFKMAEGQLDHFQISYKEKEEEAKALRKTILRLQRTCTDQENSINSLKHDNKSRDKDSWYDSEISRLANVEQNLRREVESCWTEIEALRQENISFLKRLNEQNGNSNGSVRLEEEIRQRIECLQCKGLCLLDECSQVCTELLKCVKNRNKENFEGQDANEERHSFIQYTMKYESLRKGIESLKRSLQCVSSVLDEKSSVEKPEQLSGRQHSNNPSEVELDKQLKSESMINKILRENLFSKEKEIEQLQDEVASLVRGSELLKWEIQRLQDEISCITYKTKDMEIQTAKKEERINQLQEELQETIKELTAMRSMLKTAMDEKDFVNHEVMRLQKANKDLRDDNTFLYKRVESLDEDLLIKDGEISILKDSILEDSCRL